MRFKVGDRVKYNDYVYDEVFLGTVVQICTASQYPYLVNWDNNTQNSFEENSPFLELVQPEVQEPVVEDPIPGKFYKTRGGDKLRFLVKGTKEYVYEDEDGEIITRSLDGETYNNIGDIVGEWVDEVTLPAMEIKRWAIVSKENHGINNRHKRGWVYSIEDDFATAKEVCHSIGTSVAEIVELTGTLPERKVTNDK